MKRIVRHSVVLGAFAILSSLSFPAFADSSSTVELEFTFASTLTTTLSSADIFIHDITPGTSKNSNSVNLNITTNNFTGYVVSASTGDANNNSSDLIQTGITDKFSSIAASANLESLTTDDTWGYSTKVDTTSGNGTSEQTVHTEGTWSNLNGLATTSAPIYSTNSPLIADVNFRIAARASEDIEPGEYTNTINFFVVVNPAPVTFSEAFAGAGKTKLNNYYKMQDMSPSICNAVVVDTKTQLIDTRDNKTYWVLKAKDGKCWMTQNLDHDIVTTPGFYTPANTDVYAAWTSNKATIKTISSTGGFDEWPIDDYNTDPYSADPGEWYWTDTYYNDACLSTPWCRYTDPNADSTTLQKFSHTPPTNNGVHNSVGNYYSLYAALAVNGTAGVTTGEADASICPSGWKLPSISDGDFANVLSAYDAMITSGDERDNKLVASPLYFVRAGYADDKVLSQAGYMGYYWSSSIGSSSSGYLYGYRFSFGGGSISAQRTVGLGGTSGYSIRCVARESQKADPGSFEYEFASAGKSKVIVGGNKYHKMQDMTASICSAVNEGQETQLVDSRDNTVYRVGKLADNRCWLLDNLALDLTNSTILNKLYDDNTNADATALNYLKGRATRNPATDPDGNYATAGVANWASSYSYSAPLVNMASKDVVPQDSSDPLAAEALAGSWKVGGYYNYCAASAGSYCYGDGTSSGSPSGNASSDICPSGWRMPTGGASGEYLAVYNEYSGTSGTGEGSSYANFRKALSLPLSGFFYNGSAYNQGSDGRFWSSTYSSSYNMYTLYVSASLFNPQYRDARYSGYSVRCIAQ